MHVSREELRAILKDKGVVVFLFIAPFAYPLLYGAMYTPEVAEDIPAIVVDEDDSMLSRAFVRMLDATPEISVVVRTADRQLADSLMLAHQVNGYFVIPRGFQKELYRGEEAVQISLVSDLASVFFYKAYMTGATNVSLEISQLLREQNLAQHLSRRSDAISIRPVRSEVYAVYNPQGGYASFLMPSVLVLVLQQVVLLAICMMVGTARERGHRGYIDPSEGYTRGLPFRVVWGRAMAYLLILVLDVVWGLFVAPKIFGLPMLASPWALWRLLLPFMLGVVFFAQTVALFVRGREEPMIYLVFTSLIFMFSMGISWPFHAMPPFWQSFSHLFPAAPMARAYVGMMSMGASLEEVSEAYFNLWLLVIFYFLLSSIGHRFLIHKVRGSKDNS